MPDCELQVVIFSIRHSGEMLLAVHQSAELYLMYRNYITYSTSYHGTDMYVYGALKSELICFS